MAKTIVILICIIVLLVVGYVVTGYFLFKDRGNLLRKLDKIESDNRDNIKLIEDAKRIAGERDKLVGELNEKIARLTDRIAEYQKLIDQGKTIFAGLVQQNRQLVDQLEEVRRLLATGTVVSPENSNR